MQSWELRVFCPCPWTVRKAESFWCSVPVRELYAKLRNFWCSVPIRELYAKLRAFGVLSLSVNCTQSWELSVFCPYPWAVRKAESFWCSLTETLWWRQNVKRGKIPQNAEISSWSKRELAIVSPKSHIYNGYKITGMFNHKTFTADHVCWSRVPLKNVMWCIIKNKIKKGDTRHCEVWCLIWRTEQSTTDVVSCFRHTLDVPADRHAAEGSGRLRQTHGGQHFPGRAAGRTDGWVGLPPPPLLAHALWPPALAGQGQTHQDGARVSQP